MPLLGSVIVPHLGSVIVPLLGSVVVPLLGALVPIRAALSGERELSADEQAAISNSIAAAVDNDLNMMLVEEMGSVKKAAELPDSRPSLPSTPDRVVSLQRQGHFVSKISDHSY